MREFCPRKQGVSRGLRPNLLILNKGAITSLSLFKPFSSNRARAKAHKMPQDARSPLYLGFHGQSSQISREDSAFLQNYLARESSLLCMFSYHSKRARTAEVLPLDFFDVMRMQSLEMQWLREPSARRGEARDRKVIWLELFDVSQEH